MLQSMDRRRSYLFVLDERGRERCVRLTFQPFSQPAVTQNIRSVCAAGPLNNYVGEKLSVIAHTLNLNGKVPAHVCVFSLLWWLYCNPRFLRCLARYKSSEKHCLTANVAVGVVWNLMQSFARWDRIFKVFWIILNSDG